MMRGARTCSVARVFVQCRAQSDTSVSPSDVDAAKIAALTGHIRANDTVGSSESGMDQIRGRMQGSSGDQRPVASVDDPSFFLSRQYRDAIRDTDPLGGQFHKDYFRDPAKGYAPQHAPRNFADGGRVDYHTPRTSLSAEMAVDSRSAGDHKAIRYRQRAAALRSAAREMTPDEFKAFSVEEAKKLHNGAPSRQRAGVSPNAAFNAVMSTHTQAAFVPDQFEVANRGAQRSGARAGAALNDSLKHQELLLKQRGLESDLETFRVIHGLREQEKHEFELSRRTARRPNVSFDSDRAAAVKGNKLYGQAQFDPLLPTSTMAEAQTNLRKNALPDDEALYSKILSRNTVQDQPLTGEQLTQSMLGARRLSSAQAEEKWEEARREALGLGRQSSLTQENGPDKRKMKLHKNDERLLNAFSFVKNAYHTQLSPDATNLANSANPTERNDTSQGVAHLLTSKFDIDRRSALLSSGKADPAEATVMHYGVPMPEQLDAFVRGHRNAKGDRHTDYFLPFPSRQDMTLATAYRDLEGFPLMKQRPEFLEWELFARYRAHHQQRRALALVHGLEPVPNETVSERDARRLRLDQLCEATPFNPALMSKPKSGEVSVSVEGLRRQFGAYMLPSPTIINKIIGERDSALSVVEHSEKGSRVADGREHLLSARYLNKLGENEAYLMRVRGANKDIRNNMPEPNIRYLPDSVTATFNAKEFALYNKYIEKQVEAHERAFTKGVQKRRWIAERNAWSKSATSSDIQIDVVDAVDTATGTVTMIALDTCTAALGTNAGAGTGTFEVPIEGVTYKVNTATKRPAVITTVVFDDNSTIVMEERDYHSRPLAVQEADPNAFLNYGLPNYHYNRVNYIETQDAIWEEATYKGEEGWTIANERDGLREGLPVLARRPIKRGDGTVLSDGELQRAEIVQWQGQPFYNPNPRHVTVRFVVDGTVDSVPLSGVYIWQLTRNGPERTIPDESRKTTATIKRYVDIADPLKEKVYAPHFLDRYRIASTEDPFRSVKQITDIDLWNINDESRADNVRPLTIAGRKNYVKAHYLPNFTPWDWIVIQEMDTPLIAEQIRMTGAGDSLIFSPNRYWRWKRKGHGYVQNSPNEVKDLFRYIDQITPWKKAQKVRNLWEVRQHHPFPKFHRPEVAMHRNSPGLLPSHMWEVDKKSGKVKSLKDSVSTYQTLEPYPKWVQL